MRFLKPGLSAAVSALIIASPALAEITPEDLWADWTSASDQPVTVTRETREGDALVIEGAVFVNGPTGSETTVTFPKIVMTDAGNGSLRVELPEGIVLNTPDVDDPDGPGTDIAVTAQGMTVGVSGDRVEDAAYALDAPEIKSVFTSDGGPEGPDADEMASVTIRNTKGTLLLVDGIVTAGIQSGSLEIAVTGDGAVSASSGQIASKTSDLSFAGRMRVPPNMEDDSFSKMVKAGFLIDFTSEFGPTDMTFHYADGADNGTVTAAIAGINTTLRIDERGLVLAQKVQDLGISAKAAFGSAGDTGGRGTVTASLTGLSFVTDTKMPALMLDDEAGGEMPLQQALEAGLEFVTTLDFGNLGVSVDLNGTEETGMVDLALSGGRANLAVDPDGIGFGFVQTGMALTSNGFDLPFPILDITLDEAAFDVAMPVLPSDTPGDFRLLSKIDSLNISDSLWILFDPEGKFQHGPLTQILDITGTTTLFVPIDQIEAAQAEGKIPAELNSITLTMLKLAGLGAEFTGSGSLTIDNTGENSFHGMPRPLGTLTFDARGVTALLKTAGDAGLLPEDALTGIRMGMAMFLKPGAGEDTQTSQIEFREEGLFVNGMQIQ